MWNYPILNPISALFPNYLTDKRPISRPVVWSFGSSAADCLVHTKRAGKWALFTMVKGPYLRI